MNYTIPDGKMLYRQYNNMFNRCYNAHVQEIKPWYKDCTMCKEWLEDKNSFYEWVKDGQFYELEGEKTVELDHDIIHKGNKVYSPETCVFAPQRINSLFGGSRGKKENNLPTGITLTKNGLYKMTFGKYTKIYDTVEEAFEEYKRVKEAKIIMTALEYKGKIPTRLFEAMMNWKVEITD